MKLYFQVFLAAVRHFIFRQDVGRVICHFAEKMGIVYIKMAQILAMQNIGHYFTEENRKNLQQICDNSHPIAFSKILKQICAEYGGELPPEIKEILPEPIGAASVSQVHKAILTNGQIIAIKIKRQDVARKVHHDVNQLRRLIHRFGRFAKMYNLLGSDKGLLLWAEWIEQETDFCHECENLEHYQTFTEQVNGKIPHCAKITMPKLYSSLCTENIIVMEFIESPTLNKLELNSANKARIARAENSYIMLSFYALFHDLPVVVHGDPHGGNIYIDQTGDLGFLDFGLVFVLTLDETVMLRELFLASYLRDGAKVVEILLQHSNFSTFNREKLELDVQRETEHFQTIPVPQFFIEMIGIFTKYNIEPPEMLFKIAKAFLAIFGVNTVISNQVNTKELLMTQVIDFYLRRTSSDLRKTLQAGVECLPTLVQTSLNGNLVDAFTTEIEKITIFQQQLQDTFKHGQEILKMLKLSLT